MAQNCCDPLPNFELWYSLDYVNEDVDAHHRNYSVGDHELVGDAHIIDTHSAAYITSSLLWVYAAPFILVVGTIGSVLSLLVLCRKSMRSQTTMFYLAVLAVTDLMVLYTGLVRLWLEQAHNIYMRLYSDTACKLHTFVVYISLDCSAWILVAVSVDRCLYVTWPHRAKIWCTIRNARITVTAIAGTVCLVNLHFFWTYQLEGDEHDRIYSNGNKKCYAVTTSPFTVRFVENVWPWIDLCVYCLFPFLFMMISNVIIIKQLVRSERTMKSHAKRLFFRRSRSKSALKTQRQASVQSNDVILETPADEPASEKCARSYMILGFAGGLGTVSDVLQQRSEDALQIINGGGAFLTSTSERSLGACVSSSNTETLPLTEAVFVTTHPYYCITGSLFPSHQKTFSHEAIPLGFLCDPDRSDDYANNNNNDNNNDVGMPSNHDRDISKTVLKPDKDSETLRNFHSASFRGLRPEFSIPDYQLLPEHKSTISPSSVSATFAFGGDDEYMLLGTEPRPVKGGIRSLIKPRRSHSCKVHPMMRGTTDDNKPTNHETSAETSRPDLLSDTHFSCYTSIDGNIPNTCLEGRIPKDGGGGKRGVIQDYDVGPPAEIHGSHTTITQLSHECHTTGADTEVWKSVVLKDEETCANTNGVVSDGACTRTDSEAPPPREPSSNQRRACAGAGSDPQPPTSSRRNTSNVSMTLVVVTMTFWLLNAPIVIFIVGYTYWAQGADHHVHAQLFLAWAVVNILQYINNAIHLFLYCLTSPRFRQELMTMVKNLSVGVQRLRTHVSKKDP